MARPFTDELFDAARPIWEAQLVHPFVRGIADGTLPLELTLCNKPFTREASVTAINDEEVRPILVSITSARDGKPCHAFQGKVNLESLREHFKPGINRFAVTMSGAVASTVLNVEM